MTNDYPRLDQLAADLARESANVVAARPGASQETASSELRGTLVSAFEVGDSRLLESTLYAAPFASFPGRERDLFAALMPRTPLFLLFGLHVFDAAQARELISVDFVNDEIARATVQVLADGEPATVAGVSQPDRSLPSSLTVIVHGTGAAGNTWWRPTGQFAQDVHAVAGDVYQFDDYFRWNGKNRDPDRRKAAVDLKAWVDAHLRLGGKLRVIAHSHGGNVAMLATRLGLRVSQLILLGTPMRTEYVPAIGNIARLDNIYAPQDVVQSPGGALPWIRGEGRTLGDSAAVNNHPVQAGVGGSLRAHSDLHEWSVWTHSDNRLDRLLA